MQNPPSGNYTKMFGAFSDGVSLTSYTSPLSQSRQATEHEGVFILPTLRWEFTDAGAVAGVHYIITADIFGHQFSDLPEDAVRRLACFYMIAHLDRDNLRDAYGSLTEMYGWQQKVLSHGTLPISQPGLVPVSVMDSRASAPFGPIEE
jgi:hypothetical protein